MMRNFPKELNEKLHELCESLDIPNEYEVIHKIDLELMTEAWNKIEKHYQSQIDNTVRDQEALAITISNIEEYIKKAGGANNLVARNVTKKER